MPKKYALSDFEGVRDSNENKQLRTSATNVRFNEKAVSQNISKHAKKPSYIE